MFVYPLVGVPIEAQKNTNVQFFFNIKSKFKHQITNYYVDVNIMINEMFKEILLAII